MPIFKWARCHLNDIVFTIHTWFLVVAVVVGVVVATATATTNYTSEKNDRPLCVTIVT